MCVCGTHTQLVGVCERHTSTGEGREEEGREGEGREGKEREGD